VPLRLPQVLLECTLIQPVLSQFIDSLCHYQDIDHVLICLLLCRMLMSVKRQQHSVGS